MEQVATVLLILLILLILADFAWIRILWLTWWGGIKWPFVEIVEDAEQNRLQQLQEIPSVVIFIPARNEARGLEQRLRSVLQQDYPNFSVRFVDDQSTDETLAIAQRIAHSSPRLHVLRGESRPSGWLGKPWALHQLTRGVAADWFLFVDADIVLHSQALSQAMHYAHKYQADLLSFTVGLELETFWQRVLGISSGMAMPAVAPLLHVNDPKRSTAFAAGGFLLFRRSAYEAVGGHEAVKNRVVEDITLAHRAKEQGLRLIVLCAPDLVMTDYYGTFREIWTDMRKNLYALFGFRPRRLLAFTVMFSMRALMPWIGLILSIFGLVGSSHFVAFGLVGSSHVVWYTALALSLLGLALMVGMTAVLAHLSRCSPLYALSFPLGALTLLAIAWNSAWAFHFGSGIQWKGRSVPPEEIADTGQSRDPTG